MTFYGGYMYANLGNPSNSEANGFQTVAGGIFIPSGAVTSTAYDTYTTKGAISAINTPSYPVNKILNTIWTGFKWSIWDNLDFAMGFYYQTQNNFNFTANTAKINGVPAYFYTTGAPCTGTGAFMTTTGSNANKCAGSTDAVSAFLDWRPVKRVDLYAGVMVQNVYGGYAVGYAKTYYAIPGSTKYSWQSATTQSWDPTIGIRVRF